MRREDHLTITEIVFGEKYDAVHKWLDETFPKYLKIGNPFLHWKERHHVEAIQSKYKECMHALKFNPKPNPTHMRAPKILYLEQKQGLNNHSIY